MLVFLSSRQATSHPAPRAPRGSRSGDPRAPAPPFHSYPRQKLVPPARSAVGWPRAPLRAVLPRAVAGLGAPAGHIGGRLKLPARAAPARAPAWTRPADAAVGVCCFASQSTARHHLLQRRSADAPQLRHSVAQRESHAGPVASAPAGGQSSVPARVAPQAPTGSCQGARQRLHAASTQPRRRGKFGCPERTAQAPVVDRARLASEAPQS